MADRAKLYTDVANDPKGWVASVTHWGARQEIRYTKSGRVQVLEQDDGSWNVWFYTYKRPVESTLVKKGVASIKRARRLAMKHSKKKEIK